MVTLCTPNLVTNPMAVLKWGCPMPGLVHSRANSLDPGRYCSNFKKVILKHMLWIKFISPSWKKYLQVNASKHLWRAFKIGSGNGPSNKPFTWANVDPDLCRHMTTLGHSGSNSLWQANNNPYLKYYGYEAPDINKQRSTWWLQMPWWQMGARASTTTMVT